jgi:hypothetical protein
MENRNKPIETTSLWSVIESMQERLENEGLEEEVVDAAITGRLAALLRRHCTPRMPLRLGFAKA